MHSHVDSNIIISKTKGETWANLLGVNLYNYQYNSSHGHYYHFLSRYLSYLIFVKCFFILNSRNSLNCVIYMYSPFVTYFYCFRLFSSTIDMHVHISSIIIVILLGIFTLGHFTSANFNVNEENADIDIEKQRKY